jgi:hypothetical protein
MSLLKDPDISKIIAVETEDEAGNKPTDVNGGNKMLVSKILSKIKS